MNVLKTINKASDDIARDVVKHSPGILTGIGCVGVVGTGVLAAMATPKAIKLVHMAEKRKGAPLTFWEKIRVSGVVYIPAAVVGTGTIVSIISSNHISSTRLETMAAAYQISETARKAYQEKVLEEVGPKKEEKIRSEIAKDKVHDNPPVEGVNAMPVGKSIDELAKECRLIYDGHARGMYFEGSSEILKRAERDIEWRCKNGKEHSASLNDFYDLIGLTRTNYGEQVGFNPKNPCKIDIHPVYLNEDLGEAGGIVTEYEFIYDPIPNFDDYIYDGEECYAPWESH